jgi:hypothetical protein
MRVREPCRLNGSRPLTRTVVALATMAIFPLQASEVCIATWRPGNFILNEYYLGPCPGSGLDFYGTAILPQGDAPILVSASNNPPGSAIGPYMGLNNYANLAFSGFDTYLAGDPQNPTYPHSDTSYQYQYFNYGTWSITDDRDLRVAPGANAIFGNYGIFQKSGGSGTTTVDIDFFNSGTINVASGKLVFAKSFNGWGGTINLGQDATLGLSGNTNAELGTISNGRVEAIGTGVSLTGGNLTNMTLTGSFEFKDASSSLLAFSGNIVNNGSLFFNGRGSTASGYTLYDGFQFRTGTTLSGTGTIVFSDYGNNDIQSSDADGVLTVGSGQILSGSFGIGDHGHWGNIVNQGTFLANTNRGIGFYGASFDNTAGVIKVVNDSTFAVSYGELFGGTILGDGTGKIVSSGTVSHVTFRGGMVIGSGLLRNVAFQDGVYTVPEGGLLRFEGSILNNGTLQINDGIAPVTPGLQFADGAKLLGNGEIVLGGPGISSYVDGVGTLTIGAGQTIRGAGSIGLYGNKLHLVNEGTVIADASANLFFEGSELDNSGGHVKVINGSTFIAFRDSGVTGGIIESDGTGTLNGIFTNLTLGGGFSLSGGSFNDVSFNDINYVGLINLSGKTINNGKLLIEDYAYGQRGLTFADGSQLLGAGEVVLTNLSTSIIDTANGSGSLIVGAGQVIRGTGYIGGLHGYGLQFVNQGTVLSDIATGIYFHGASFDNSKGLIQVADGASFTAITGSVVGGVIEGLGGGHASLYGTYVDSTLKGKLQVADGARLQLEGTVTNNGTLAIRGQSSSTAVLFAPGSSIGGSGQVVLEGQAYIDTTTGSGTLTIGTGQTIRGSGRIGGSQGYGLSLVNRGLIASDSTTADANLWFSGASFENQAQVRVDANHAFYFDRGSSFLQRTSSASTVVHGTLYVPQLDLEAGTLSGNGLVVGSVVNSGGVVSPGASPGKLTIQGDYLQKTGGSLVIQIYGDVPGVSYDVLSVLGNATLGGDLYLDILDPSLTGGSFDFITATGLLSGSFDHVYAHGVETHLTYGPHGASVTWMSAVPESSSWMLAMSGLMVLSLAARRGKQVRAAV